MAGGGTTNRWIISSYELKTEGLFVNIVTAIHWRLQRANYSSFSGNTIYTTLEEIYGVTELGPYDPDNFIEFDDITQEIAEGWITGIEDEAQLFSILLSKYNNRNYFL